MIYDLSTTTDPALLVPGAPEAIYTDADELDVRATTLSDAATTIAHHVVESWIGDASSGWAERRAVLDDSLAAVADVLRVAAEVLRAHADVLVWARGQAGAAIDLWASAPMATPYTGSQRFGSPLAPQHAFAPAQAHGAGFDPHGLRRVAEAVLADARAQVGASGDAAAAVLDELSAGMPDGQWHTGQFFRTLGQWVMAISPIVRAVRLAVDREGVAAEAQAQVAGMMVLASADPEDKLFPLLFDTQTFEDNPAGWWGSAAPEAALAIAGAPAAVSRIQALHAPVAPRTFVSADPLVGELATWIEAQRPGWIRGVNHQVPMLNGDTREIDIEVGNVLVQVKSERARHLPGQMMETMDTTGRVTIAYAPTMPYVAWRGALYDGLRIARTREELMLMLVEFQ